MEKKISKLEHQIEASHEDLQAEIKELRERQCHDKWTICGLMTCMEGMEAQMGFLQAQLAALIPTPTMDSSRKENGGEAGDEGMLRSPSGTGIFSSL